MPNLYIIAGCNGAGKTTASFTVLPKILKCQEFVNADEIARGLSPFQPDKVAISAARIMLLRIDELIDQQVDFAIETTLTTRYYLQTTKRAKEKGYYISLIFFWLNDVELAIERVKIRVNEGGHSIPEDIIRRRYIKGIRNFNFLFKKNVDFWLLINNSDNPYTFVAEGYGDKDLVVYDRPTWPLIKNKPNDKGK
jgi:predicted ABC-type ATPase